MTFFNTIGENQDELSKSIAQAKSQEAKIMRCFKYYEGKYPRLRFSPSMVLKMTGHRLQRQGQYMFKTINLWMTCLSIK